MERWPERTYIPSWQEISITLGLAALGFVAFSLAVKYFKVFGEEPHTSEHAIVPSGFEANQFSPILSSSVSQER
jgi:hypothetical protein